MERPCRRAFTWGVSTYEGGPKQTGGRGPELLRFRVPPVIVPKATSAPQTCR